MRSKRQRLIVTVTTLLLFAPARVQAEGKTPVRGDDAPMVEKKDAAGGSKSPRPHLHDSSLKIIGDIPHNESPAAFASSDPRLNAWLQHLQDQLLTDIRAAVHDPSLVQKYLESEARMAHDVYQRIDRREELLGKISRGQQ